MKRWGILVAAGESRRMGEHGSKIWIRIAGKSTMEWSLIHFVAGRGWDGGVVVCRESDRQAIDQLLGGLGYSHWNTVGGGAFRHESVQCGLSALSLRGMGPDDVVLIHDAARLLVSASLIQEVSETALRVGAAVPVVPVVDTVKQITREDFRVAATLDRSHLALAQTPQGFRSDWITAAYDAWSSGIPTDDGQVVEAAGIPVTWVPGESDNRKLTTPEDLAWFTWKVKERHGI